MSALAIAMLLTGAGAVQAAKPPPPPPHIPAPPPVRYAPPVSPPPPANTRPPRRARASLNTYFSADDYPASALRAHEQGTVGFSLSIGPNGRVHDCIVTVASGSAALDQATCRILRNRARYTPARDFYGRPTFGRDSGRVSWRLPTDYTGPERFGIPAPDAHAVARRSLGDLVTAGDYPAAGAGAAGTSMIRVVVGPDGRVIACDVARGSGSAPLDAAACRIVRARARYTPARDAYGTAVCDLDAGWIVWRPPPRRPRVRVRAGPPTTAPPPLPGQLRPGLCPGWQP